MDVGVQRAHVDACTREKEQHNRVAHPAGTRRRLRGQTRDSSVWKTSCNCSHPLGCGLAVIARRGDVIEERERWTIKLGLRPADQAPSGLLVGFLGWRFMLSWDAPFREWQGAMVDDVLYTRDDILLRPNEIKIQPGRLALRFTWHEQFRPSGELVALRARYPTLPR